MSAGEMKVARPVAISVAETGIRHGSVQRRQSQHAFAAIASSIALLLPFAGAQAHHTFAAFDTTVDRVVRGVVEEMQYTNPHSWLFIKARSGQEYVFQCEGVANLIRQEWMKDTLKPNDAVEVVFYAFRDQAKRAAY
jgi:hypothetical protein